MPAPTYTLAEFIADLDRITREDEAPEVVAGKVAPLLGRLVRNRDAVAADFRRRPPDGRRGRYMPPGAALGDWSIDLGPEGGDEGGRVIATGTPEEVARQAAKSYTGRFLERLLAS
jgi:hypothetical protein